MTTIQLKAFGVEPRRRCMKVVNVWMLLLCRYSHKISSRSCLRLFLWWIIIQSTASIANQQKCYFVFIQCSVWFSSGAYFESLYVIYGKSHLRYGHRPFNHCFDTFFSRLFFFCAKHRSESHFLPYFKINMKIGFLDAKMNTHTYQHSLNTLTVCVDTVYFLNSLQFGLVPVGICCVDLHAILYILFFYFLPSVRYPLTYSWLAASCPSYVVWLLNDDVFTWQINFQRFLWE